MATTPEGRVKAKIKAYLKTLDNCWQFSPAANGMGVSGIPDIIICYKGKFVAFEVKAPGKRNNTTPNQDRQLSMINSAAGTAVVVDDVSQVQAVIRLLDMGFEKVEVNAEQEISR